eukprot:TRINITY_DN14505_c0_g4_i1.p1 TRINITY_DN14505_c0_g4~~TRINITY_DN14505_c0_g4_i1.p1  ORF type:complete len:172 (+),score=31.56 TRINITY_DN14505_c0_g4_i1:279-794(+)
MMMMMSGRRELRRRRCVALLCLCLAVLLQALSTRCSWGAFSAPASQPQTGGAGVTTAANRLQRLKRIKTHVAWQWSAYCKEEGDNQRDPSKHDEAFVLEFLKREESGQLPKLTLASAELVQALKDYQRTGGSDAIKKWHNYSYTEGFGLKDPKLNSADFVREFLDLHSTPK